MIMKTGSDTGTAFAGGKKRILKILKDLASQIYIKHKGKGGAGSDLFSLVTSDKTQGNGAVYISVGDRIIILGEKLGTL